MRITRSISIIILLFIAQLSYAQNADNSLLNSKYLKDLNQHSTSINRNIPKHQAFVLVFLAAECPISQKYVPILRGLQDDFSEVQFLAIFTKWEKLEAIKTYLNEYALNSPSFKKEIPVLIDKKNKLIKKIDARITPEVFLFTSEGVLKYRGAIDNWFYGLGKYRQEASEYYLKDALISVLNNQPIKIKQTDAIGCIIEK